MLKKMTTIFFATIMLFLTLLSAVEAYNPYYSSYTPYSYSTYSSLVYSDLYPVSPNYLYYDQDKYDNLPVVTGPYPRYYLFNTNMDKDVDYVHDDFNHYDEFIGYKDLDVFYPNTGVIEVIRNENSRELDLSQIQSGFKTFGLHVYGYIPGPNGSYAMYRKHYQHEHPLELETYEYDYNYGYNYGYGYYTPVSAYTTQPVYTNYCQSRSICQLTHSY